jgi:hypothetical protein
MREAKNRMPRLRPPGTRGGRKGLKDMVSLLWLLFVVLLVLWLVGFAVNWGAFVWLLLIAAAVVLVTNLIAGGRTGRWY